MRNLAQHQDEYSIWYSDSAERLYKYYKRNSSPNGRFWGALDKDTVKNALHMPLVGDICETSANLLFSEPPTIDDIDTSRLETFLDENDFHSYLLESADMCAGMGGVFLKINTDPDVSDFPILTAVSPTNTDATFRYDQLFSVKFYRFLERKNNQSYYMREKREVTNGTLFISYAIVYFDNEGKEQLAKENTIDVEVPVEVTMPMNNLGVVYVPNHLPNRLFLGSSQGVPDYGSSIGLLGALDEVWTSWIRDIELGQAKVLADKSMLDDNCTFNQHAEAFIKMDMDEWRMTEGKTKPIEQIQFNIRYKEHSKSAMDLTKSIISRCGYAPQSFGINDEGTVESGAALKIRERKSFVTRNKKARYWQYGVEALLFQLQQMDSASDLSPTRYDPRPVNVSLSDSVSETIKEVADTVKSLNQAGAASLETLVEMVHPEWSDEQVSDEIDKIKNESGEIPFEVANA